MTDPRADFERLLYQQDFPEPPRCSEHSVEGRCINVGKFVLVTAGGEVEKFSCRTHLAQMVCDLRTLYRASVLVDLSGREGRSDG